MTEELISRADFEAWFRIGALVGTGLIFFCMSLRGFWRAQPGVWVFIRAMAYSAIPVLVLGLLKVYGSILDRWGLDRIQALGACVVLFVLSGGLVGGILGLMERVMDSRLKENPVSKAR